MENSGLPDTIYPMYKPFLLPNSVFGGSLLLSAINMQATSDDHSELEPRLPIPNRTVKRLSADDSADYPCESRTSSGTLVKSPVLVNWAFFCFVSP